MSGYGEASGNLILKIDENLKLMLMDSESIDLKEAEALFEYYDVDPTPLNDMGFSVNDRSIIGDYLSLDIFDGSWIEIAKLLSHAKTGQEVAGEFWDDYGGSYYVASDGNGNRVSFNFEEESDEMEQENFDEAAYFLKHEQNKEKWTSLIPKSVHHVFND